MNVGDIIFWPVRSVFEALTLFLGFLVMLFVVWMLVDCFNRKFRVEAERWIWIVLILITQWVGALLYYVFIKNFNIKGVARE